jgi:hypothetical protein
MNRLTIPVIALALSLPGSKSDPETLAEPTKPVATSTQAAAPPIEREFILPERPASYREDTIGEACAVDRAEFMRADYLHRYMLVTQNCHGQLQAGMSNGSKTNLYPTSARHRVNGGLVNALDNAMVATGAQGSLPQPPTRMIIFHDEDGRDGLPGGNLNTQTKAANTGVQANLPITFTSIPLKGDATRDTGGLATELCQTRLMMEKDATRAESVCNGFGLAVKAILSGWDYSKYLKIIEGTSFYIEHSSQKGELSPQKFKFEAVQAGIYDQLQTALAVNPEVLTLR